MMLLAALPENRGSFKDSLSAPGTSNNVKQFQFFKPRAHAGSGKPHGTFAPLLPWMVGRCRAFAKRLQLMSALTITWSAEP